MFKLTLVGAGSVVFAKNLISDILQYPALSGATICLMDIDAGRLQTIKQLALRIVSQLGVSAKIEATLDLREACSGAKFVITTIQVGGYKPSTVTDFEIPAKYGVQQTIADTLGVGGVFRALRSIPALVKVARTLQEVGAPEPLLLNYTNPMAMNMWAIDRMTGIDSVGLCHSVQGTSQQIAAYCGLDFKDVSYLVAGINHMAFFLRFEYKGKDAYPFLFRALDDPSAVSCDRVRFEMMRRLGYFVTESSEHQSEYVPFFIHHGAEVIKAFNIPINEYIRRCEAQGGSWERVERDLLDTTKPMQISRSIEYGSTVVHSVVTGEPSVIYGNVPNRGLITNLTDGCSVEVPCLVDRQGIQPTHIGKLPPQLAAIIHTNLNVQELTVEAAITGRRDYIYQAVMADPHTAAVLTLDKIWSMCDELIDAHQKTGFLGQFSPVARNTGKPLSAISRVFLSLQPEEVPFLGGATKCKFQLRAKNETSEAFSGGVRIVAEEKGVAFHPSDKFDVQVAAGETIRIPFTVERTADMAGDLVLLIVSPTETTVERDFHLPKRRQVAVPASASGAVRCPITVEWSGNPVADGAAWLSETDFSLEFRVDDTDLRVVPASFWEGSAVEIGLKDAILPNAPSTLLVILPDPDAPRILAGGQTLKDASVTVRGDKGGYCLSARMNLASAGLNAKTSFLLELVFHVNALGSAHGKVRVAWQGSANMRHDQSRFALVVPTFEPHGSAAEKSSL